MKRDELEERERRTLRNLCYNATPNQGRRRVKEGFASTSSCRRVLYVSRRIQRKRDSRKMRTFCHNDDPGPSAHTIPISFQSINPRRKIIPREQGNDNNDGSKNTFRYSKISGAGRADMRVVHAPLKTHGSSFSPRAS